MFFYGDESFGEMHCVGQKGEERCEDEEMCKVYERWGEEHFVGGVLGR